MPQFDLILPEGRLLLRNPETGETLTISAESGPVTLGRVEFSLALTAAGAAPDAGSLDDFARAAAPQASSSSPADAPGLPSRAVLAPGVDPEALVRAGAAVPEAPMIECERPSAKPRSRIFDAPMDALTAQDFDDALASLVARRSAIEDEIGFMREIDGDPDDIAEMEKTLSGVTDEIQATNRRLEGWRAHQREIDKRRGAELE